MMSWFKITEKPNKAKRARNAAPGSDVEIILYGYIGDNIDWWTGENIGNTAQNFLDQVKALGKVNECIVRINSLGGSVVEGYAIYGVLSQMEAKKIVVIDGIAASVASVIAMAGDEIQMPSNALIMIHDPETIAIGGVEEMDAARGMLERMKESSIAAYRSKNSALSVDDIAEAMSVETWYTAEQAKTVGFCDTVLAPIQATQLAGGATMNGDKRRLQFKNTPAALKEILQMAAKPKKITENKSFKVPGDFTTLQAGIDHVNAEGLVDGIEVIMELDGEIDLSTFTIPSGVKVNMKKKEAVSPTSPVVDPNASNVTQLDAARGEGEQRVLAHAREVKGLCDLGGYPEMATDFVLNRTPVEKVREALLQKKAEYDAVGVSGHHRVTNTNQRGRQQSNKSTEGNNNWDKIITEQNAKMGFNKAH
jgi:ATP-dependent protease ClpP protease subunit